MSESLDDQYYLVTDQEVVVEEPRNKAKARRESHIKGDHGVIPFTRFANVESVADETFRRGAGHYHPPGPQGENHGLHLFQGRSDSVLDEALRMARKSARRHRKARSKKM